MTVQSDATSLDIPEFEVVPDLTPRTSADEADLVEQVLTAADGEELVEPEIPVEASEADIADQMVEVSLGDEEEDYR